MDKAEEKALTVACNISRKYDGNAIARYAAYDAYVQAEKDLALTYNDITVLSWAIEQVKASNPILTPEKFGDKVIRLFNESRK